MVSKKKDALGSDSFLNNGKWIITSDGLKKFGTDSIEFDNCIREKECKPTRCDRKD